MTAQTSLHDHFISTVTSAALAAAFLVSSTLPARAQGRGLVPPPLPPSHPVTAPSRTPTRMSIEIDTGSEKFLLKPVGGTVYDVYREADNQKIGSANVATGDLMPLGPDFAANNATLQIAKTAYMQGKSHPYNSGDGVASNNNDAVSKTSATNAAPQATFTAAGEAVVQISNDRILGGSAKITISADAKQYTAEVVNGTEVTRRITATFAEESGAGKVGQRIGGVIMYAGTSGIRGSLQASKDAFKVKTVDSSGATSTTKVQAPGSGNSKVASREEVRNDILDNANAGLMLVFYKAKETAIAAKTANVAGSSSFNPDAKAVALIDAFGVNDRQLNGTTASRE
jgi:hypothetical protein